MSKRSDLLLACMLGNRWERGTTTVGASCAASSPVAGANSRVHLETLLCTVKNLSASTAHTVSLQVRGTNGQTVLWNVDLFVNATSTVASVGQSNLAFATPKLGTGLLVGFNTALGSVSYSVNIAGWIEDTNG
jgi:hypothetical protein